MSAPFRPLAGTLEQRRVDVERVEGMAGALHSVVGFIEITNAGEVTVDISFPVRFIERPAFTFGAEMQENSQIIAGSFPTVSGVVLRWNFGIRDESGARYYDGATLIIVNTGTTDQQMIFHYKMEGKALRNPLAGIGSVSQSI